jgi:hypothetical protein
MSSSARGRWTLLAVAVYLTAAALAITIGPYASVRRLSGRAGPPEERPGITPAAVSMFLVRIGEEGRTLYHRALLVDFVAPAAFVGAGWMIVGWSRERAPNLARAGSFVVKLLVLLAATEVVENLLLLSALRGYPGRPALGELIGTMVGLKLWIYAACAVSLVGLIVVAMMNPLRSSQLDRPANSVDTKTRN